MFRLSLHLKIISVVTLFSSSIFAANLDNPNWSYSGSESFDSMLSIDGYSLNSSGFSSTSMSTNIGVVNSGDTLEFRAFIDAMAFFMSPQSDVMIRDNLFINAGVKITGSSGEKIVFDLHDGGSYSHNNYFDPIYTPEWIGFMIDYETYNNPEARAEFLEEQGMSLDDVEDPWEAGMMDFLDGVVDLTPLTGQDAQLSFILEVHTSGFYDQVSFIDMFVDSYSISNTNAVPVPAAALLFGSALAGLGVMRRKK